MSDLDKWLKDLIANQPEPTPEELAEQNIKSEMITEILNTIDDWDLETLLDYVKGCTYSSICDMELEEIKVMHDEWVKGGNNEGSN